MFDINSFVDLKRHLIIDESLVFGLGETKSVEFICAEDRLYLIDCIYIQGVLATGNSVSKIEVDGVNMIGRSGGAASEVAGGASIFLQSTGEFHSTSAAAATPYPAVDMPMRRSLKYTSTNSGAAGTIILKVFALVHEDPEGIYNVGSYSKQV